MTEVERLRMEAESCRRLAQQSDADDVKAALTKLAAEYLERARALERGSARQQPQDRPPQPSQHPPDKEQE